MEKTIEPIQPSFIREHFSGNPLPLIIRSGAPQTKLPDWIQSNRELFEDDLVKHGSILFRGFGIDSPELFSNFMTCFDTQPLPYMFRSSPRKELNKEIKNIYQSTTYPNDRTILLHNETSYSRIWGRKIIFCCLQPALSGGETPIADSRKVYEAIPSQLRERFEKHGVKYLRNLFPTLGMPWQEVFQTENQEVAQEICRKFNIQLTFLDKSHATISWVKPASYKHPVSGENTWFNHIFFFNKYSLYEEIGLTKDDSLPEEMLPSNTYFGDGSPITFEDYQLLKKAYSQNTVTFSYEKGDVLVLDNMLTAHGRMPYKGDRVIATAIIESFEDKDYYTV